MEPIKPIKEILLEFQKAKGLSGRKFAKEVKIAPTQWNRYLNGINVPSMDILEKVKRRYPDFDYSAFKSHANETGMTYHINKRDGANNDDILECIQKGSLAEYANKLFQDCKAVPVNDLKMQGYLGKGDIAAVKGVDIQDIIYGEKYYIVFKSAGREPTIQYLRKAHTKDSVILKSENPDYDDHELPINQIKEVYLVKGGIVTR